MTLARVEIIYPDGKSHAASLTIGENTFGKSIDCDFVIFDDDIEDNIFKIDLSDDSAKLYVQSQNGVLSHEDEATTELDTDSVTNLRSGQSLSVASVTFVFEEIPSPAQEALNAASTPQSSKRSGSSLFKGIFSVRAVLSYSVIILLALGSSYYMPEASEKAPEKPRDAVASEMQNLTPIDPLMLLRGAGVEFVINYETDTFKDLTFYTENSGDETMIRGILDDSGVDYSAEFYSDTALFSAASTMLGELKGDYSAKSIDNGNLVIDGTVLNDEELEDVFDVIKTDIQGIRDVTVLPGSDLWKMGLNEEIVGIWYGERPFVLMQDGTKVRENQILINNLKICSFEDRFLLVLVDDKCRKYKHNMEG